MLSKVTAGCFFCSVKWIPPSMRVRGRKHGQTFSALRPRFFLLLQHRGSHPMDGLQADLRVLQNASAGRNSSALWRRASVPSNTGPKAALPPSVRA